MPNDMDAGRLREQSPPAADGDREATPTDPGEALAPPDAVASHGTRAGGDDPAEPALDASPVADGGTPEEALAIEWGGDPRLAAIAMEVLAALRAAVVNRPRAPKIQSGLDGWSLPGYPPIGQDSGSDDEPAVEEPEPTPATPADGPLGPALRIVGADGQVKAEFTANELFLSILLGWDVGPAILVWCKESCGYRWIRSDEGQPAEFDKRHDEAICRYLTSPDSYGRYWDAYDEIDREAAERLAYRLVHPQISSLDKLRRGQLGGWADYDDERSPEERWEEYLAEMQAEDEASCYEPEELE